MRGFKSIGVMAIIVLAIGALGASTALAATKTVSVSARQPWTDTGIALNAGEKVEIKGKGTINWGGNSLTLSGPVGFTFGQALRGDEPNTCGLLAYTAEKPGEEFILKGANCYSMLFRIGASGKPFATGKKISFAAPLAGELFLGVNDQFFGDNSGAWTAKITTS
jgi:hypothetical protein